METAVTPMKEECPLCGSELSRVKYFEIQAKLRTEEDRRSKLAKLEAQKVLLLERKKLADEREQFELKARAEKEALKQKNEDQREALEIAREALDKAKAEKTALEKKGKEATDQAVAAARKQIGADLAKKAAVDRAQDRAAEKAEFDRQALKLQAEWSRERLKLLAKNQEQARMLEAKRANELGDGAEIDIYENLKSEWDDEGDKIRRIKKGEEGADILHEVRYKGEVCGRILIESKNRQKWLNEDTSKLHDDMVEAGAEHGILAATKFPAAKNEMFTQDGVLVVRPIEVLEIVRVIREGLVRMHTLKLGNTERAEKTAKLYEFINSPEHKQKLAEVKRLAQEGLDQEEIERKQHNKWWEARALAARKTQKIVSGVETEIGAIIDGKINE
jgi:hypothetical protein